MFDPFTLAMIGAGIGAITNPKKPIQGAIIGGGLGYGGGLLAAPEGATAKVAATTGAADVAKDSIASEGLKQIGDTYYNMDYYKNLFGNPIYTGGEGLLSNIGDELKTSLSSISPQNLLGVASLLNQPDTSQYRQMAGTGGGVSRGSGQGLALEMPQARVFKRRKA